jgi:CheY-like chemotaxis protein
MNNKIEERDAVERRDVNSQQAAKRMPRILVAEDDAEMRHLLVWHLRKAGFDTIECTDGYQLLDHLGNPVLTGEPDDFDLIVSDIRMPGVTGMEVLEGIYETEWFVPMILITAFGNDEVHRKAESLGAAGMFDKPFEIEDLIKRIKEVLVLESSLGHNWAPQALKKGKEDTIPVDVVYDNMDPIMYMSKRIRELASILKTIQDKILYCRVVINGPHELGAGRYHIQVMVTLSDKVFVVRSNQKSISSEAELYDAIPTAFKVTLGKIQKYLNERKRQ